MGLKMLARIVKKTYGWFLLV